MNLVMITRFNKNSMYFSVARVQTLIGCFTVDRQALTQAGFNSEDRQSNMMHLNVERWYANM